MNEVNFEGYETEQALRHQAEQIARRSLTDDEWALVAPDWNGPYDDLDVAEIVAAVRDTLPAQPKPSAGEKTGAHRRAQVERAALEAREMVERAREDIFGYKEPPFPHNRGIEAAMWLEAQAQKPETKRFHIEVTVPARLGRMESLNWLRDYLTGNLNHRSTFNRDDDSPCFGRFLDKSDAVRNIGWTMPLLAYLGVDGEGEIEVKQVQAPDDTLLGRLLSKAEKLAKATNWKTYAAVHHLLTGGIVSPSAVQANSQYRAGREVYGDTYLMTLEIPDPALVTQQDLITAFSKERSDAAPSWDGHTRQRSKAAPKRERVAAFVEERPAMPWAELLAEWNRRNPEDHYRTESAMKGAFSRANRR